METPVAPPSETAFPSDQGKEESQGSLYKPETSVLAIDSNTQLEVASAELQQITIIDQGESSNEDPEETLTKLANGDIDNLESDAHVANNESLVKQAIKKELIAKWEAEHGSRWQGNELRADYQDFVYGDMNDYKRDKKPISLEERVDQAYQAQYGNNQKVGTTQSPTENHMINPERKVPERSALSELKPEQITYDAEKVMYGEYAPKFWEIVNDAEPRDNILNPEGIDKVGNKTGPFTERQGLKDLDRFLVKAMLSDNPEIETSVQNLRENLCFIGEKELQKAVDGMASHVLGEIQSGQEIYLYVPGDRSERYISLRIAESLAKLLDQNPEQGRHFHLADLGDSTVMLNHLKHTEGLHKVIVADDFVVSGARVRNFVGQTAALLQEGGFSIDEAMSMIEAMVVSDKATKTGEPSPLRFSNNKPIQTFAYYKVPHDGAVTGSHTSVDFGFEVVVEEIRKAYSNTHKIELDKPKMTDITRPYELNKDRTYKDKNLQTRWEKVTSRFGLKDSE